MHACLHENVCVPSAVMYPACMFAPPAAAAAAAAAANNGSPGICRALDGESGRWRVSLAADGEKSLKPENLESGLLPGSPVRLVGLAAAAALEQGARCPALWFEGSCDFLVPIAVPVGL